VTFEAHLGFDGETALVHLAGAPADGHIEVLRSLLRQVTDRATTRLVLRAQDLESISTAAARCLAVAAQESRVPLDIVLADANDRVREVLEQAGLDPAMTVASAHD
jgi:anti-anti-sigma factor